MLSLGNLSLYDWKILGITKTFLDYLNVGEFKKVLA